MKTNDPRFELVRKCVDGDASDGELRELEELLKKDHDFRLAYLRYINIDSTLEESLQLQLETRPVKQSMFIRMRPVTAAAAGLVIGLVCASVAWAMVLPKGGERWGFALLEESFEDTTMKIAQGFPLKENRWAGNLSILSGDREPVDGALVLKLDSNQGSTLSYIQKIIDAENLPSAPAGETRTLAVSAAFHSDSTGYRERYNVRIATFSESPSEIHKLWVGVPWTALSNRTLTMTKAGLNTTADAAGWQTVRASIEIPSATRSIVISLGAGRLDAAAPKTPHYIDDVRAFLEIGPPVKRSRKKRIRK